MPSDEEFEAQRTAVLAALSDETMTTWFADMSRKLEAAAICGKTEWVETTLPNLETMLSYTPVDVTRAQIKGMTRICLAYGRHWITQSDVDVDFEVRGEELVRTKGACGLRMRFHWAPDGAESEPKKRRVANPPPLQ